MSCWRSDLRRLPAGTSQRQPPHCHEAPLGSAAASEGCDSSQRQCQARDSSSSSAQSGRRGLPAADVCSSCVACALACAPVTARGQPASLPAASLAVVDVLVPDRFVLLSSRALAHGEFSWSECRPFHSSVSLN